MTYDQDLLDRLRVTTQDEQGLTEKRMFGGVAFLVDGAIAVCASSEGDLMVRVGPGASELLGVPGTSPMTMGDRTMKGWLRVSLDALATEEELRAWVARGVAFARSLTSDQRPA